MNQNTFAIVGVYAGLGALILMWLSFTTIKLRGEYKVSIGDGENKHLARVMRGHANAIENLLILLLLMILMAALGTPEYILHGFGILLIGSRFFHAHHFIQADAPRWSRYYPMVTTLILMTVGAIAVIGHGLRILLF